PVELGFFYLMANFSGFEHERLREENSAACHVARFAENQQIGMDAPRRVAWRLICVSIATRI
ncbi:MAG: hypothetical protein ACKO15_10330, partial [Burkholderiales bacterium]